MILLRKVRDLQLQLSQAENPIARSKVRIEIAEIMERIKVINNEGNTTAGGEEKTMSMQQQQFIMQQVKPKHKIKPNVQIFYNIVEGEHKAAFEGLIMACILLNGTIMGLDYFGQPRGLSTAFNYLNILFASIFNVEAAWKILGIGWSNYKMDAWNRFDFSIVIGTDLGYVVSAVSPSDIGGVASVVRLFRIARIFRLFARFKV